MFNFLKKFLKNDKNKVSYTALYPHIDSDDDDKEEYTMEQALLEDWLMAEDGAYDDGYHLPNHMDDEIKEEDDYPSNDDDDYYNDYYDQDDEDDEDDDDDYYDYYGDDDYY